MSFVQRANRELACMEATVTAGASTGRAEIRDISASGVALSWLDELPDLHFDGEVQLVPENQAMLPAIEALFHVRENTDAWTPNGRFAALRFVRKEHSGVIDLIQRLSNGPAAPKMSSAGFKRAWNMLEAAQRAVIGEFVDSLVASSSQGRLLAHNLLYDPNVPASELSMLFHELFVVTKPALQKLTPVELLVRALAALPARAGSDPTNGPCRSASSCKGSSRSERSERGEGTSLSRFFRDVVVRQWVLGSPIHDPGDLITDILANAPGAQENFRTALRHANPEPYLGRNATSCVWCAPSDDIDRLNAAGFSRKDVLESIGLDEHHHFEMRYRVHDDIPIRKPSALDAGMNHRYRFTPLQADFGMTVGSSNCPGIREVVHAPLRVIDVLENMRIEGGN